MISILITGVGSLLGQGILKSIQNSNLNCYIIGTDYFNSAVGLYWVDKGYLLPDVLKPEISESDWVKSLIQIIMDENIDLVIPGLDFEIPILANQKFNIESKTNTKILVSSKKIVNIGDDKWETVNFLKSNGFDYPKSCLPDGIDIFLKSNSYPFIVKPRFGHTSENVFLVHNYDELNKAMKVCDKPIIQEYLKDSESEYTCGVTYIDKEIVTLISLRRLLKNGNTQQAFCEKTKEIDSYIRKLTLSLKPYGPINFQLRDTHRGPIVFEINPRFSGTTPMRKLFGINEVEAVINKLMNLESQSIYEEKEGVVIRYFENQFISKDKYKNYK